MYNLDTAFPWSPLDQPQFYTVYLAPSDETSAYEPSRCSSYGYVCGGFEVVADGMKYPNEDRRLGDQETFDILLLVWRKLGEPPSAMSTLLYKELSERNP